LIEICAEQSSSPPIKANRLERAGRKAKGPVKWQPATERRVFTMKKTAGIFVIILVFLLTTMGASALEMAALNTQSIETGILSVQYSVPTSKPTKIMIENGGERAFYSLLSDRTEENFPLNMGDGQYKISILEQVSGNQYRSIKSETIQVSIKDITTLHLGSIQEIRWNEDMEAIKKAGELTEGLTSDLEKVKAIYKYMISNVSYDYAKIPTLTSSYLPDVEQTFYSNKGICYDYSSLFAAMVRSIGVPAKMAKGYAPGIDEYHAWNEVLIEGEWKTVDTTMDAAYHQAGYSTKMIKNSAEFNKTSDV